MLRATFIPRQSRTGSSGLGLRPAGMLWSQVYVFADVAGLLCRLLVLAVRRLMILFHNATALNEVDQIVTANPHRPTSFTELVVRQLVRGAKAVDAAWRDAEVSGSLLDRQEFWLLWNVRLHVLHHGSS